MKYMKRVQLSNVASRIIWKSCGNIERAGINIRVLGKSICIVKIQNSGIKPRVQIIERKMTNNICKSRLTLNSVD